MARDGRSDTAVHPDLSRETLSFEIEGFGYGLILVQNWWVVRRAWVLASAAAARWVERTLPLQTHSVQTARYA